MLKVVVILITVFDDFFFPFMSFYQTFKGFSHSASYLTVRTRSKRLVKLPRNKSNKELFVTNVTLSALFGQKWSVKAQFEVKNPFDSKSDFKIPFSSKILNKLGKSQYPFLSISYLSNQKSMSKSM